MGTTARRRLKTCCSLRLNPWRVSRSGYTRAYDLPHGTLPNARQRPHNPMLALRWPRRDRGPGAVGERDLIRLTEIGANG